MREPELEARANFTAAARDAANNATVKNRISEVNGKASRGKYKQQHT